MQLNHIKTKCNRQKAEVRTGAVEGKRVVKRLVEVLPAFTRHVEKRLLGVIARVVRVADGGCDVARAVDGSRVGGEVVIER